MTNNDLTPAPRSVALPGLDADVADSAALADSQVALAAAEPKRRWPTAVRVVAVVPATFLCYAPLFLLQFPTESLARQGNWGFVMLITMVPFVLMTLMAALVVWLMMHFLDRRPLSAAGIRVGRADLGALLLGIAVSLVAVLAVRLAAAQVGWVPVEGDNGSMAPTWLLFVVVVIGQGFLMQGIPEELFFRGYLTQTLGGGPVRKAVISGLVFGSIHVLSNGGTGPVLDRIVYVGNAAAFGFAAAALYFATGSLWAAIGIHGGLHLGGFVASMNLVGEGPTSWLIGAALYVAVGIAALAWCRRLPSPVTLTMPTQTPAGPPELQTTTR